MSLDSTDVAGGASASGSRRARRDDGGAVSGVRLDWRLGGRTVHPWRAQVLAVALLSVGVAVLLGTALTLFVPALGGLAATAVLWIGMLLPIVFALSRSRPAGLFRFRFLDLLWGVGLGLILRTMQGWLEVAVGGSGALPSYPSIGGSLPSGFVFTEVLAPVLIAPAIELFFHAVVLVAVYTLLRRPVGMPMAGVAAVAVSAGLFLLLHSLAGPFSVDGVVSLALLAVVCGALVMLTGRVWPVILVHVVYNGSYVVLALLGTYLG